MCDLYNLPRVKVKSPGNHTYHLFRGPKKSVLIVVTSIKRSLCQYVPSYVSEIYRLHGV